jgi:hypothetical protein
MNKHQEEDFPLSGGEEPENNVNIVMVVACTVTILVVLTYVLIRLFN